jgi:hypothetical protein
MPPYPRIVACPKLEPGDRGLDLTDLWAGFLDHHYR